MSNAQIDVPLPMQPIRIVSLAAAVAVALGTTVLTATPALAGPLSATPTPTPTATPTPTPAPIAGEPWATALGQLRGHSAYERHVTITGTGFLAAPGVSAGLAAVLVDGTAADDLVVSSDTSATFLMGAAPAFQPGSVTLTLESNDDVSVPTALTFTYIATNRRDKELAYAGTHWALTSSARFGYIFGNDCADFTSQLLLARGWKQSSQWYDRGADPKSKRPVASSSWISSTAMSDWLHGRPDLAKHLGYSQADRDQVVVGDIVQFDWDSKATPGVWQHTAVVSKIVTLPNGHHDFYYTAHTTNRLFGGTVGALIASGYYPHLHTQFWHLKK
ncbi:MAG TPA: amidase domain-containing protein [Amnibacterium sp.]|uniref:amidase domain-containing protein n=1 Tax=Amnibacterium sp. TaxID=1872496 RepID=UPI002F9297BE